MIQNDIKVHNRGNARHQSVHPFHSFRRFLLAETCNHNSKLISDSLNSAWIFCIGMYWGTVDGWIRPIFLFSSWVAMPTLLLWNKNVVQCRRSLEVLDKYIYSFGGSWKASRYSNCTYFKKTQVYSWTSPALAPASTGDLEQTSVLQIITIISMSGPDFFWLNRFIYAGSE